MVILDVGNAHLEMCNEQHSRRGPSFGRVFQQKVGKQVVTSNMEENASVVKPNNHLNPCSLFYFVQ